MSKDFCFYHPRGTTESPVRSTLNRRAIKTIVASILEAWDEIETFKYRKSPAFEPPHFANENELTTKLAEVLNHKLDRSTVGPFRKEKFQTVVRDAKQSTGTLGSTSQMPDLTFRMVQSALGEDRDESALFVEAKLIDTSSGCGQYVIEGLHRFVSGKYAPRTTFGLMLGYGTADFNDASGRLGDYFSLATSTEALLCKADVSPSHVHEACFETTHQRAAPCAADFRAMHLWVPRNLASEPS